MKWGCTGISVLAQTFVCKRGLLCLQRARSCQFCVTIPMDPEADAASADGTFEFKFAFVQGYPQDRGPKMEIEAGYGCAGGGRLPDPWCGRRLQGKLLR